MTTLCEDTADNSGRIARNASISVAIGDGSVKDRMDWRAFGAGADALGIGVVLLNNIGEPDFINKSYRSFLGMGNSPDLDAKSILCRRSEGDSDRSTRAWIPDIAPGNVQQGQTADGRPIRYTVQPLAQGGLLCVAVDATAIKRDAAELRRARESAETATLAKSRLLAMMSHELRTPLNAISGYSRMLLHDGRDPLTKRQREYLDLAFRNSCHLLDLLNRVLDLQKIEAGQIEIRIVPVEVSAAIRECVEMFAPQARLRDIVMTEECLRGGSASILADPIRFRQVMANLISNAVKYNRPGGHVWVSWAASGNGCRIGVRDTGNGIPNPRRDEVFQPFNRLGREASRIEGLGLGLAISRDLVELMGGQIGFDSEPGRGSTFWVEMPLAAEVVGLNRVAGSGS